MHCFYYDVEKEPLSRGNVVYYIIIHYVMHLTKDLLKD